MCWLSKYKPFKMVASEDIPVQKVLRKHDDGQLFSPVFNSIGWKRGEVKVARIDSIYHLYPNTYIIECGLHSCKKITFLSGVNKEAWVSTLHEELDCYSPLWYKAKNEIVVDAIIPKGSHYYLNEYGEYVSDKLMMTGISKENFLKLN